MCPGTVRVCLSRPTAADEDGRAGGRAGGGVGGGEQMELRSLSAAVWPLFPSLSPVAALLVCVCFVCMCLCRPPPVFTE